MKLLLLYFFSLNLNAALLDKVAGVINDQVYTLSEIQRVSETLKIRAQIAPFIYSKSKYKDAEILKILQNKYIIKDKLAEQGYVVSDDSVERNINDTQQRLRLNREQLLSFLRQNGMTYNEYFELMRTAMEYNIFLRNIISPLVIVTEQEIKNEYYNSHKNKDALSFQYEILDFSLNQKGISSRDINSLPSIMREYQKTGTLPNKYKSIGTSDLGSVRGDELPADLNELLKVTNEKEFSRPYIKSGTIHLFYLKKKDLVSSAAFTKEREKIYQSVFSKRSQSLVTDWLQRQSLNYYILENI